MSNAQSLSAARRSSLSTPPTTIVGFSRRVVRFDPRRSATVIPLTVIGSLIDMASTVMLIPVVTLLGLVPAGASLDLFARALEPVGLEPTLAAALTIFFLLVVTRAVLIAFAQISGTTLRLHFVDDLRQQCLESLLRSPWSFILGRRRSDLVQVLTADVVRVGVAVEQSVQLGIALAMVAASAAVAFAIAPGPSVVTIVVGALLIAATRPALSSARSLGVELGIANRRFAALVSDSLDVFKLVRAHGVQRRWLDDVDQAAGGVRHLVEAHSRRNATASAAVDIGSTLGICVVLFVSAQVFGLDSAAGLVVLFAIAKVLRQVGGIQRSFQILVNQLPAYDDIVGLMTAATLAADLDGEPSSTTGAGDDLPERFATPVDVTFSDVSHRYDSAATDALSSVDLVIPARQVVALVGRSGAGKTTVADLALGLLRPSGGSVRVDGSDLSGPTLRRWERSTAYVPQETVVLPTSLRNNLTWLAPEADDTACWDTLDAVGADFARSLPDGLSTELGDRGVRLSGGERQRLAVARALLRRPTLLVLDEATSALDDERERAIQNAISQLRGEITVVVIAHRLSTVRDADHVVVLDAGRVVEQGTWVDLMDRPDSRFRQMVERHGVL